MMNRLIRERERNGIERDNSRLNRWIKRDNIIHNRQIVISNNINKCYNHYKGYKMITIRIRMKSKDSWQDYKCSSIRQ